MTTTKPPHKSWAGLVTQQLQQQQSTSRQESVASENSCETVAESCAWLRSTEETAAREPEKSGMERVQSVQGRQTIDAARTTPLVAKEQICFDFTKGQCRRGEGCKFSHDVAHIIRVNSQEKGVCFDFLKGTCARGVMCRFSHDLGNLRVQDRMALGEGNPGRARRPSNASICYDFIKNKCTKGDACKYSHDYSAIMNKMSGSRRGSGCITPPRGSMMRPDVIGSTSRAPDMHQCMRPAGQTCVDHLGGSCPRGPFCEMAHGEMSQEQPESLESLINRLKKMQYEQAVVTGNTTMLSSPPHGMVHANSPPFHHHQSAHHPPPRAYHSHSAFSYPPLTSMYSDGARLMGAHWSGRHTFETFETSETSETSGNENQYTLAMSPLSPPVTLAEKSKLTLRRSLLLQQQGIQGQQLTALSSMDPHNDTNGVGSPMISAGWQQIPHTTDANQGHHESAHEHVDAPSATDDLINMMTTTIWPDDHA